MDMVVHFMTSAHPSDIDSANDPNQSTQHRTYVKEHNGNRYMYIYLFDESLGERMANTRVATSDHCF